MPIGLVALLDTAVKVGLGAAITGAAHFLNARQSHSEAVDRDRMDRKRQHLEQIALSVEKFSQRIRDYTALVSDWYDFEDPERDMPGAEEHEKEIQKSMQQLYDSTHELTSAESKLLLIGQGPARDKLRAYGESAKELFGQFRIDQERIEPEAVEGLKDKLKKSYEELFAELSKAYDKNE